MPAAMRANVGWLLVLLLFLPPAAGPDDDVATLAADAVARLHEYRTSLEPLLALRQAEMDRAARVVERQEGLVREGLVSRSEVERIRDALAVAQAAVDETRRAMTEADEMLGEALARQRLAELPPPPVGGSVAVGTVVLYNGPAPWSLADTPRVARFFEDRFHRALPISSFGQTVTHEQLGFDHHAALDVAVHPDSVEGQALTGFLRAAGIPYLAFREARPGTATGAHIHVGPPSSRLARVR
jgi:hypothetical protein